MIRRCWARLTAAVLCGALSVAQAAWPQTRPKPPRAVSEIRGLVQTASGASIGRGALVMLESARGGFIEQSQTDDQGRFGFTQLGDGVYVVRVRQPGFREASEQVDLTTNPTAYLLITLHPLPSGQEPPSPLSLAPTVSVEELNVPEPAQKNFEQGRKLLLDSRDPAKSVAYFQKAIKSAPKFARAHFLLGTAYMDMGKWEDAEAALDKATQLDDTLAVAYLAFGSCLNAEKKFAEAARPLERGLELAPDVAQGHYELGRAYWALGRWQEAEPHALKAAELQPDLAPVYVLLGNIMLRKRDPTSALHYFREYLRRAADGPLAAPTRDLVAKLEKALSASH